MAERSQQELNEMSTRELVGDLLDDGRTLLRQEIESAKREVRGELAHAKRTLVALAIAAAGALVAIIVLAFMFANLLALTALSYWASLAIAAACFALLALIGAAIARQQARKTEPVPRDSVAGARDDARYLREHAPR